MNCPNCNNLLIILELNRVEIDYCTSCEGIWLDSGELELLLENEVSPEALNNSFRVDMTSTETKKKCPICSKKMEKILFGQDEKASVHLDKCCDGHGLWFDKGELHSVAQISAAGEEKKLLNLLNEMFAYKIQN